MTDPCLGAHIRAQELDEGLQSGEGAVPAKFASHGGGGGTNGTGGGSSGSVILAQAAIDSSCLLSEVVSISEAVEFKARRSACASW